jgi:hypothetical protein
MIGLAQNSPILPPSIITFPHSHIRTKGLLFFNERMRTYGLLLFLFLFAFLLRAGHMQALCYGIRGVY